MKSSEVSYKHSKNLTFILRNLILIAIILIATKFLLDKSPSNDYVGWLIFIVFWTVKGSYDFFEDRRNGRENPAFMNRLIMVLGYSLLLWEIISFLFMR